MSNGQKTPADGATVPSRTRSNSSISRMLPLALAAFASVLLLISLRCRCGKCGLNPRNIKIRRLYM